MKILVFADLHYFGGERKGFNAKRKLVEYAEPMIEEFKRISAHENVSLVINLGDIIQDTNDKLLDLLCLSMMFKKLKEFPCPVYSVLGNHDLKMADSIEEVESLIEQNRASFSVDIDGYHLVFLSPELHPEFGTKRGGSYKTQYIGKNTLRWLEADLANTHLPVLLFTHFPLADDPRVEDECAFLKNRDEVKQILLKNGQIKAVFVGHQHTPRFLEEDGIPYYIIGSPTTSLHEDGVPLGVYCMIETKGEELTILQRFITLQNNLSN